MYTRSPIYDDPKYRCLCDTHVEKGAFIIAIIGAVLSGLVTVGSLIATKWHYAGVQGIWLLLYLSIIFAQRKREPSLYLPYLIMAAIGLVLGVLICLFLVVIIILGPEMLGDWLDTFENTGAIKLNVDDVKTYMRIFLVVEAVVLFFALLLSSFFYWIVFRAWRYMRDEQDVRVPQASYMQKI